MPYSNIAKTFIHWTLYIRPRGKPGYDCASLSERACECDYCDCESAMMMTH